MHKRGQNPNRQRRTNSSNSRKRYSCYKNYYALMFSPGIECIRIPLPHCSEKVVKDRYSEDFVSKYVFFQRSSGDICSKKRKI